MTVVLLLGAGLFFAAWPHAMREARFAPSNALMMYGLLACVAGFVWSAAARDLHQLEGRSLSFGLLGAALNALGGLFFAYLLARRSRVQLAEDVMILLVIQVALNAAWASYQSGTVSWRLIAGTATALVTIVLLR
jgi:hypothetical protein